MSKFITVCRFFTIPVHELFGYFIDPRLIERWRAPEGMSLHVPTHDVKIGGKYRYVLNTPEGKYITDGHYRNIVANQLIQTVDETIMDPEGNLLAQDLACEMKFASSRNGSGVEIRQTGFQDEEMANENEKVWNKCFDRLQELVKDSGPRQFQQGDEGNRLHAR